MGRAVQDKPTCHPAQAPGPRVWLSQGFEGLGWTRHAMHSTDLRIHRPRHWWSQRSRGQRQRPSTAAHCDAQTYPCAALVLCSRCVEGVCQASLSFCASCATTTMGHTTKYRFGSHQPTLKSLCSAQKDTAMRPAQNVSTTETRANAGQDAFPLLAKTRLYNPRALAIRSTGANDQFHAIRIGLS